MSTTHPDLSDPAESTNAALHILAAAHGLLHPNGEPDPGAALCVAGEWGEHEAAEPIAANCRELHDLYDAALAVLCQWYGIQDRDGFRRYLANFGRNRTNA